MSTIEITRMEDVQVGDLVTLEDRRDPSDDGTFEPDPEWRLTGHVRAIDVTHTTRDGEPYGWSVRIGHTPYTVGYLSPGGVMWAYSLMSATREVPEWEPGTSGTATVRGVEGVRVMRLSANKWVSPRVPTYSGTRSWFHTDQNVTDFTPDDASRWAAQAKLVEADLDNARAVVERLESEVERLRDSMDANTNVLISSNGTIWHHDTHCPNRRATPTRKQIVDAMWPEAPEGARAAMMYLPAVHRVRALFEQGDES